MFIQKKNRFSYVMKPPKKPGRQNFPPVFFINGAIYITLTDYFEKTGKIYDREAVLYLMRKEESLDINEKSEFEYANFLNKKSKIK
jgi:CMP-N-acetylneuraminic acid synthetase